MSSEVVERAAPWPAVMAKRIGRKRTRDQPHNGRCRERVNEVTGIPQHNLRPMEIHSLVSLLREAFSEFLQDKAPRLAAALAYYTIFALAPLLLITIVVAGWLFGQDAAAGQVAAQLEGILGGEAAGAVENMIAHAGDAGGGLIAGILGGVAVVFGATNAFLQLQDALNTIWNVQEEKTGIKGFVVNRLLSLSMVLAIGFLLMVGMFVNAFVTGAAAHAEVVFPVPPVVLFFLSLAVQFGVYVLLFGAIYKVLPDVQLGWRDVWFGAVVTALLFIIGQALIGLYLGSRAVASAFGAAGSLIVVLVWVFYSAQLVLLGGEITHVYARRYGSLAQAAPAPEAPSYPELPVRPSGAPRPRRRSLYLPLASGILLGLLIGRKST